jgi:phosphopantothenoylcysteine decarboxylase / phosphopantothenate---cysteine ligase
MAIKPLDQKHIILGITGSIAAYKAVDIASKLTQGGALVDVILTASAEKFITPLTFQSVTGRRAFTDSDLWGREGHVTHIALGHYSDLVVIAPASANTIAKLANGMGDNLLSIAALASHSPLILAPAMDAGMFSHPATQTNIETLRQRGATFVGPASGHLASGLVGPGRLSDPQEVLGVIRFTLSRGGPLAGKKIVITAGGTQEAIDPVRVITNRSSGKQGFAIAQAALDAGAEVVLVAGRNALIPPYGCQYLPIQSAQEMSQVVLSSTSDADVLIMAAAVADFRPLKTASQKIKKEQGAPVIELEPTQDILALIAQRRAASLYPRRVVGFAAESQDLIKNASIKMQKKALDMVVANDISSTSTGFDVDLNKVIFLYPDGSLDSTPVLSKSEVAEKIIEKIMVWF